MIETIHSRYRVEDLPSLPLPFYARSAGGKCIFQDEGRLFSSGLRNPFIELIWGISGIGELELFGKAFQMKEKDVFYYLPNEDHQSRAISPEWKCRWLVIDGFLAEAIFLSFKYPRHQSLEQGCPIVLLDRIEQQISSLANDDIRSTCELVFEIVSMIGKNNSSDLNRDLVKASLELIRLNLSDSTFDINRLCELLNTSRSTLSKLFSVQMGVSPGVYLKQMRLVQAKALLEGTELPIKEVASKCGMPHVSSFSRTVSRDIGSSPQAYRKQEQHKRLSGFVSESNLDE